MLVTDGIPTAGATTGESLRGIADGLRGNGVERLDAVAVGGIRDDDLLKSVANAGLAHGGVVIDGSAPAEERWRRLNEATRSGLEVKVEGARFSFPRRIDGVQAGDHPQAKPVFDLDCMALLETARRLRDEGIAQRLREGPAIGGS